MNETNDKRGKTSFVSLLDASQWRLPDGFKERYDYYMPPIRLAFFLNAIFLIVFDLLVEAPYDGSNLASRTIYGWELIIYSIPVQIPSALIALIWIWINKRRWSQYLAQHQLEQLSKASSPKPSILEKPFDSDFWYVLDFVLFFFWGWKSIVLYGMYLSIILTLLWLVVTGVIREGWESLLPLLGWI